jgi:hypothetical protein
VVVVLIPQTKALRHPPYHIHFLRQSFRPGIRRSRCQVSSILRLRPDDLLLWALTTRYYLCRPKITLCRMLTRCVVIVIMQFSTWIRYLACPSLPTARIKLKAVSPHLSTTLQPPPNHCTLIGLSDVHFCILHSLLSTVAKFDYSPSSYPAFHLRP